VHDTSAVTTFLFTDIEGSTRLWEREPERMQPALACHDALARTAVESHGGTVVKMTGDGLHAAFDQPLDAIGATLQLQQALTDPAATNGVALRVRCGLHLGVVERRDNDYFGNAVNRTARIMGVAHGGQVIVSQAVVDRVADRLPAAVALRDLGAVRLKDLARPERVYQVMHPQLRQDFPALRSLEAMPNNLPQQITSFVGRERALAEVRQLLSNTRFLTMTGVGGLGKTRLSLQVGAEVLDDYADGVWFVQLAPLSDARLVPQAVASVLGVKEEPGRSAQEALLKFVKDRQLLLILDNCEHLAHACAELAKALLQSGAQVKVLASSRESLHVVGETTYPLLTLAVPDPKQDLPVAALTQYEAVHLFRDRALAAQPVFQVNHENAAALADICHRLDGIPLALELAAARVRALSVETIAERLSDRFHLLTGGDATALPRLQTLRACLDWSYDLLTEPERALLGRLAVFAGGWTLAAAEAVGTGGEVDKSHVLDLLTYLVQKSLVEFDAEGGRYRLLETVRQYAGERLEESGGGEAARERHRDYFLALAEEAEPKLTGPEQTEWLQRLEEEHENLRASLEWSFVEVGSGGGLRLCGALHRFWETRGHLSEGRDSCLRVLGKAGVKERMPERAKALNTAGVLAQHQGDYPAARAQLEESLAIRRELGDRRGIAGSLGNLGNVAKDQSDFASARALLEECLAIQRELGGRWGIGRSLNNLAVIVYEQGDFASARSLYEESLAILRELGDRSGIAVALGNLGSVRFEQRDYPAARALYEESLAIRRELGDRFGIAVALEELATLVAALGGSLHAARIWSAAERLRAEISSPLPPNERPRYDGTVAKARAALNDDAAFDSAWQEGRALTLEQAIEFALQQAQTGGLAPR
jgi:predicted ATPase/class 3 adenylate cyclase